MVLGRECCRDDVGADLQVRASDALTVAFGGGSFLTTLQNANAAFAAVTVDVAATQAAIAAAVLTVIVTTPSPTVSPTPRPTVAPTVAPTTVAPTTVAQTVAQTCLLYTSPSPRDGLLSRMPSSA